MAGASAEQQAAAANLGGIVGWNMGTLTGAAEHGDKVFDISDEQNKALRDFQTSEFRRDASNDWFTQQQKLQSVTGQLREAQGGALRGSNLYDMLDLLARKDDMDDVEVLNNLRENLETVDKDYYKAIMATNNSRNEMYMDTEKDLRDLAGDYAAQLNSLYPTLADSMIDKEGHTIKPPDWLKTSYFDEHVREAVKPEARGLVRPENFSEQAWGRGEATNAGKPATAAMGSPDYWSRMFGGYERRI